MQCANIIITDSEIKRLEVCMVTEIKFFLVFFSRERADTALHHRETPQN